MLNMGTFGFLGAHEFAAGREVVEEGTDFHLGARSGTCFLNRNHLPTVNRDLRGGFRSSLP